MNPKHFIFIILLFLFSNSFAQRNEILLTKNDQTTSNIKAGDHVRLSYPTEKLSSVIKKSGEKGIRGKIDSIGKDKIWIKGTHGLKPLELNIKDITAIKKTSSSKVLLTLGATYVVIAGAVIVATTQADMNPATTAFGAAASIFPALILTTNIFYPAKPKDKTGKDYKIDVITVF